MAHVWRRVCGETFFSPTDGHCPAWYLTKTTPSFTDFLAPASDDGAESTPDIRYDEALALSVDGAGVPLVEHREARIAATETR